MVHAYIAALASDRLGRREYKLAYRQAALDDELEDESGALRVDVDESRKVRKVVLMRGEVHHVINTYEGACHVRSLADIAHDQFRLGGQVRRRATRMDADLQVVEDAHRIALRE
jgi:hypothetical protein